MNKKKFLYSIIITLAFLFAVYGNRLLQEFISISFDSSAIKLIYGYAWWVLPICMTLGFIFGFKNIISELGLSKGFFFGFVFGLITVSPMLISSAIIGEIDHNIHFLTLLHKTLFAGFFEELLFRGFLFGILFRKLGWGFIPASALGAVMFGLGHVYQGSSASEVFGVFFITFMGSSWFAWLYIEWKSNLWVPVFLHIFMNLSWTLFNVSDNALGDLYTNIFRIFTIALTVVATILYSIKRDKFRINKKNLITNIITWWSPEPT